MDNFFRELAITNAKLDSLTEQLTSANTNRTLAEARSRMLEEENKKLRLRNGYLQSVLGSRISKEYPDKPDSRSDEFHSIESKGVGSMRVTVENVSEGYEKQQGYEA